MLGNSLRYISRHHCWVQWVLKTIKIDDLVQISQHPVTHTQIHLLRKRALQTQIEMGGPRFPTKPKSRDERGHLHFIVQLHPMNLSHIPSLTIGYVVDFCLKAGFFFIILFIFSSFFLLIFVLMCVLVMRLQDFQSERLFRSLSFSLFLLRQTEEEVVLMAKGLRQFGDE